MFLDYMKRFFLFPIRFCLILPSCFKPNFPLPRHNFRRHPVRRPHHRVPFAFVRTELGAETEVRQLYCTDHSQQNVVTLDVSMDDAAVVKELQCL